MSKLLIETKPGIELSDARRARIRRLIDVLETQRFFKLNESSEVYEFAFDRCSDALQAYKDRRDDAIELVKALEIAELEVKGEYREVVHDILFEGFGANGLDMADLAKLPEYLILASADELDPIERDEIIKSHAAGLPFKILVQIDDVFETSIVDEGRVTFGLCGRQLLDTAIGLADIYVVRASAACLFRNTDALLDGLTFNGPALFSLFSGANEHSGSIPAFLVAAASTESRVFPTLVYDPSTGDDWATRLKIDDNPAIDNDWRINTFTYEDEKVRARSEEIAFTVADFMAMDKRFYPHFAVVARDDWNESLVTVPQALDIPENGLPSDLPSITLVDESDRLQRAIVGEHVMMAVRRCRTQWRSLRELGSPRSSPTEPIVISPAAPAGKETYLSEPAAVPAPSAVETIVTTPEPDSHGDDPYIETARCTTCNECTQLNDKMFAYNDDKQAYIADPDAGTFRQLVEAAEGCQVSIIHPGKPRNPKEPGLDDLIKRAAEFE
jgi:hypothetical protein